MAETITARLSQQFDQAELSKFWESERAALNVPEIVLEPHGQEVTLRFHSAGQDPHHERLKKIFEQAVQRYSPECKIEWLD